jgi:hypothetical protein
MWYGASMIQIDVNLHAEDERRIFGDAEKQLLIFLDAGFSPAAAEAISRIDVIMQRIRRGMIKRKFVVEILKELDPSIDIMQLDVLGVIANWKLEPGTSPVPEVTVGLVAERASRSLARQSSGCRSGR